MTSSEEFKGCESIAPASGVAAASNTAQVSSHSLELALFHQFLSRQVTKAWKRLGLIAGPGLLG
jgi:hypothetical protein